MDAGKIIRNKRLGRGWSQKRLADETGVSQVTVFKIETGLTTQSKFLPRIAKVLDIPLADLDTALGGTGYSRPLSYSSPTLKSPGPLYRSMPSQVMKTFPEGSLLGLEDLPVYSIVQGGRGALVLSNEPFTSISRPHNLRAIRAAYGVLVVGSSMAREYNEGDIAYIHPHRPPRAGDACVFQSVHQDGTVTACMKYLTRTPDSGDDVWHVEQTNPPKRFTLSRQEWQTCHVAVGKQSGR